MKKNDGGPAFPRPVGFVGDDAPLYHGPQEGMSLRDWLAGQVVHRFLENHSACNHEYAARRAYLVADAMIAAREVE